MTFFLSNTRTTIRRQIKAEGNRAMSRIEFVARGAQSCDDSTPQHLIFTDLNSETYNFYLDTTTNKLMLVYTEGGIPKAPEVLTDVYTITLNNFSCDSPVDSDKVYANIKFTLVSSETTTINESFTSLVVLRNSGN